MTDSRKLAGDLAKLFRDPDEFVGVCSGTVENDGTVNVVRPDGTSVSARLVNAGRGSKTLCQRIDGTWYAWREGESCIESERVILATRSRPNLIESFKHYKELLDFNTVLNNNVFTIAAKKVKISSKKTYLIKTTKSIKQFDDFKETINNASVIENKSFFAAYSDTAYLKDSEYTLRIGDKDKIVNTSQQSIKNITKKDIIAVTNCTPFRLYSFISNKITKPRTDLSFLFNSSLSQLKRDLKKYNKNCYYAWVLREISDVTLIYGYGWVNPEGKLIPTKINYEQDPGCYLSDSFVFISANNYDGHMAIDIGCFDRTKRVAKIVNGVKTYIYIPLILLPEPDPYSFAMYAKVDSLYTTAPQVSAITELQGIYISSNPQYGDWGQYYSGEAASLFNAINSTIDYAQPQNNP